METFMLFISLKVNKHLFVCEFDRISETMRLVVDGLVVSSANANGRDAEAWYVSEVLNFIHMNFYGKRMKRKHLLKIRALSERVENNTIDLCAPFANRFTFFEIS